MSYKFALYTFSLRSLNKLFQFINILLSSALSPPASPLCPRLLETLSGTPYRRSGLLSPLCYREFVVYGCNDIIKWWPVHRLKFPAFSDLAKNTFYVIATSAASEGVFSMDGHVVNSITINLRSSSLNDMLYETRFMRF